MIQCALLSIVQSSPSKHLNFSLPPRLPNDHVKCVIVIRGRRRRLCSTFSSLLFTFSRSNDALLCSVNAQRFQAFFSFFSIRLLYYIRFLSTRLEQRRTISIRFTQEITQRGPLIDAEFSKDRISFARTIVSSSSHVEFIFVSRLVGNMRLAMSDRCCWRHGSSDERCAPAMTTTERTMLI